jgi:hypothetical protein
MWICSENGYLFKRSLILYFVKTVKVSFINQLLNIQFTGGSKQYPTLHHRLIETHIKNFMNYHTLEFNLTKPHFSFFDVDKLPEGYIIQIFEQFFICLAQIIHLYRKRRKEMCIYTHTHTHTYRPTSVPYSNLFPMRL